MRFGTPMFLAGVGGMLIPVLIHLLTRDRIRRVEFSTLRFFVKSSGRILRRKRFREMVLLLLRAAACALLAAAFARPLLEADRGDLPAVEARTARVVLADVSASMARSDAPEQLRKAARQAIEELSDGTDAAAVLAFDENVTIEAPLAKTLDRALAAAGSLVPGHGATHIPRALQWADAQLKRARARTREIVLLSDLQRTGWQDVKGDVQLSPGVRLIVRAIRVEPAGEQIAIWGSSFPQTAAPDREPQAISVQLVNYSPQPKQDVEVRLRLGGTERTRKVNLRARGAATATFRLVFDTPGDHRGQIEAPGAQVFYFNTRVIPKIRVLLVDGGAVQGRLSDAAFYTETALAPGADVASPFECRTRSGAQVTPQDLADAQVAILADVARASPALRQALRGLLRRGGGLLFMPGQHVDAGDFAASFGDVAPCKLRQVRTAPLLRAGTIGAALASIDYQHPVFEVFSHPRHGDLSLPKFKRYWEVTDSQLSQVLAKFDDNRPAVLTRQVDGGVSMLLASSPDAAWTDFPRHTTFLPYVWQTVKYLAARTEQRTAYTIGDALPVPEGCRLIGPDGKPDEMGRLAARRPGFYLLEDPQGREVATYAVNRSPAEADPAAVAADEIVAAVQRGDSGAGEAAGPGAADDEGGKARDSDRQGLWWWVMLALACLLVGELLLGNKTLRH